MKMKFIVASVLAAAASLSAQAGILGDGNLSISGFGTVAAAKTNTDDVKFVRYNQAEGVGDSPRLGLDTNLGLQASYQATPDLSATVQVLSRKSTSQQFTTELTWAFLKYKLNDETSVRLGRTVIPAFLISDYQNVGYANTMMRPPIELYGQEPLESVDGADINWQHSFGDTNVTVQGVVGKSSGKLFVAAGGTGSVTHYDAPVYGFAVTAEHGPITVRAAHLRAKVEVNDFALLNGLTDNLTKFGFGQLANDMTTKGGKHMSFTEIGATLDWKNIVGQAEYAQRRAQDAVYIPQTNAWYVMAGYRFGKVLPYYAHAHYNGANQKITAPALPAALAVPVAAFLTSASQSSDLVGVRWDFAKSLALKVQYDRVDPTSKSGSLVYGPAVYNKKVNVIAAGVDFVF
ncbi:porin [Pseudoduganella sp. RAF19]|uniref:porin n=2 Tax=unclassified Pseudoduganella TaxID=2637179 RepID=UPI003F9D4347